MTSAAPKPAPDEFRPGDHVYVGQPAAGKVHWVVERVIEGGGQRPTLVSLVSPMSGRRATVDAPQLTLHTRAQTAS